jgi:hypothetical protein
VSKLQETEFKSPIAFALARQLRGMWTMARQAIEQIHDEKWTDGVKGDEEWFYSLRIYHIIEAAEFYSRDTPKRMQWGARLGEINWWETISHKKAAELISKGDMLVYLNEIALKLENYLKDVSDEVVLGKDKFHWFASILEKYQYLIRHNSFHLGELTMHLRAHNFERIKWS